MWAIGVQRAFLGSRHKDHGQASQTHILHIRRRLQRRPHSRRCGDWLAPPLRDAHEQRSAHQRNMRGAALEPDHVVCAGRCRQIRAGKETWRGHNGVQSRPDHILLSVDLASPRVTVDFQSSQTLKGTALAPIDHAPLRITLQYRFPSQGPAAESEAPGQGEICGDDDGPALCEAFRRGGGDVSTGELERITTNWPRRHTKAQAGKT